MNSQTLSLSFIGRLSLSPKLSHLILLLILRLILLVKLLYPTKQMIKVVKVAAATLQKQMLPR